ncbi:Bidirectional sugar transporter SWEET16, partial [Capsicum baccatum]
NIISGLVFLSPVGTFKRIVKNRSTEDFDSLPYICTLLNSSLWTYYGIIKPGSYLVATISGFGVVVEIVYIVLFLLFAHPKMRNKTAILVGVLNVATLATILLLVQFLLYGKMRIKVIGFLTAGLNIIMYGSPLGVMKTVVTTKSVEFMPFYLSFFLFLNGGAWTLYAVLLRDWFIGVKCNQHKAIRPILALNVLNKTTVLLTVHNDAHTLEIGKNRVRRLSEEVKMSLWELVGAPDRRKPGPPPPKSQNPITSLLLVVFMRRKTSGPASKLGKMEFEFEIRDLSEPIFNTLGDHCYTSEPAFKLNGPPKFLNKKSSVPEKSKKMVGKMKSAENAMKYSLGPAGKENVSYKDWGMPSSANLPPIFEMSKFEEKDGQEESVKHLG